MKIQKKLDDDSEREMKQQQQQQQRGRAVEVKNNPLLRLTAMHSSHLLPLVEWLIVLIHLFVG